jgi:hypothetical protein
MLLESTNTKSSSPTTITPPTLEKRSCCGRFSTNLRRLAFTATAFSIIGGAYFADKRGVEQLKVITDLTKQSPRTAIIAISLVALALSYVVIMKCCRNTKSPIALELEANTHNGQIKASEITSPSTKRKPKPGEPGSGFKWQKKTPKANSAASASVSSSSGTPTTTEEKRPLKQ